MFSSKKKGLVRSHIDIQKDERLTLLIDSSFSEEDKSQSSECDSCEEQLFKTPSPNVKTKKSKKV